MAVLDPWLQPKLPMDIPGDRHRTPDWLDIALCMENFFCQITKLFYLVFALATQNCLRQSVISGKMAKRTHYTSAVLTYSSLVYCALHVLINSGIVLQYHCLFKGSTTNHHATVMPCITNCSQATEVFALHELSNTSVNILTERAACPGFCKQKVTR